ncbi:uncharacterized protein LOC107490768 [Arachis duranensis]|uniref:Uncharacterized protein LOC107490768 n=1 Tax=Arachis duranensis TaxID=130453 RepID=A0A9C6TQ49_ARADU|nr:uncharacterized protein LOC107490768 [Arachis duranensis]
MHKCLWRICQKDLQRDIRRHLFEFIKKIRIFSLMDEPILDAICERLRQKVYFKGSTILHPGDLVEKMFFVLRGELKSIGEDGTRVFLTERDACGEELLVWCLENSSVSTALGSLPPASPDSALPLLPLPSVRNPGSSAHRPILAGFSVRGLEQLAIGSPLAVVSALVVVSPVAAVSLSKISVVKLVDPEVKERNNEEEGGEELSDIYHSPQFSKLNYAEMMEKFKVCIYADGDPKTFYQTPRKLTGKYASEGYFFQNIRESRF